MQNIRVKTPKKTEDFLFFLFTFTCRKPLKVFWVYQLESLTGKNLKSRWEKSGKVSLPPPEKKKIPVTALPTEHFAQLCTTKGKMVIFTTFFIQHIQTLETLIRVLRSRKYVVRKARLRMCKVPKNVQNPNSHVQKLDSGLCKFLKVQYIDNFAYVQNQVYRATPFEFLWKISNLTATTTGVKIPCRKNLFGTSKIKHSLTL